MKAKPQAVGSHENDIGDAWLDGWRRRGDLVKGADLVAIRDKALADYVAKHVAEKPEH